MNVEQSTICDTLDTYPHLIFDATGKAEDMRETWQLLEAKKDCEEATAFLTAKATTEKITETTAKNKATVAVYDRAMECVKAESSYRRALADQKRLENEFDAVKKKANIVTANIQRLGAAA